METLNFNEWLPDSFEQIISELISDKVDESYHSHDFYEIFYITQGYAYHIFNGEKEKLEVGDMFLIRPGDYHMFVREEGESCTHRDILLNKKLFEKCCDFIDKSLIEKICLSQKPLKARLSNLKIAEFESQITEISSFNDSSGMMNVSSVSKIFIVILINVFLREIAQINSDYPYWLKLLIQKFNILNLVREGLPAILAETNYDQSYICRIFKKYVGCTLTQYLLNTRLNIAATYLQTTDDTIENICESIGLGKSVSYFTACFKKKFSVSPKEFRMSGKKTSLLAKGMIENSINNL